MSEASGSVVCGIEIGMPTDVLVHQRGRSRRHTTQPPEVLVAKDKRGKTVARWFYRDCTVLVKYSRKRYRVAAVEQLGGTHA